MRDISVLKNLVRRKEITENLTLLEDSVSWIARQECISLRD